MIYADGTLVTGSLNYKLSTSAVSIGGAMPLSYGNATCYTFSQPSVFGLNGTFQVDLKLLDALGHTLWQVSMAMDPTMANIANVLTSSTVIVVQKP